MRASLHQVARVVTPVGVANLVKAYDRPRLVEVGSDQHGHAVTFGEHVDGLLQLPVLVGAVLALVDGDDVEVAAGRVVIGNAYAVAVVAVVFGVRLR